jgi:hypothetical protein
MGKNIGRTIFGGPEKSKSHSYNRNFSEVSDAMEPSLGYVGAGGNAMSDLLGLGGGEAQTEGLEKFANSGGMEFLRDQGNNQINSNASARGLLKSGSTIKSLERYGQGLGSTYLNQYMGNLKDLSQIGLGAGGLMSSVGQTSKGSSSGKKEGALSQAIKIAGAFA